MHDCRAFVAQVIAAADKSRTGPPRVARRALARHLVDEFVPAFELGGIDLRRILAPASQGGIRRSDDTWTAQGFHHRLVAGGQDAEALRHLAAAAAATLMGRHPLVWAENLLDWLQGWIRGRRREAAAEIAGNRAGAELGRELARYLDGGISRSALEIRLKELLCRGE